jgi:hypothetical protein
MRYYRDYPSIPVQYGAGKSKRRVAVKAAEGGAKSTAVEAKKSGEKKQVGKKQGAEKSVSL